MAFKDYLLKHLNKKQARQDAVGRSIGEAFDQADQIGQQIITMMAKFHQAALEVETDDDAFTEENRQELDAAIQDRVASLAGSIYVAASSNPKLKERYQKLFGAINQGLQQ